MKIIPAFKLVFIFLICLGIFYVLDYGFVFDSSSKLIKPFLLSVLTMMMFFKPRFKRHIIFLIGVCLVLMIIFNIFNLTRFSNLSGEFGFSLLVVTIFLYLPQIIKKGHVEKF